MGNRSNLYFNKEPFEFFEANNSLPFFWLGLLDKNILNNHREAWEKYDELMGIEDQTKMSDFLAISPCPLDFKISKIEFETNAARTLKFLQKNYPESSGLFDDFRKYTLSKFGENDSIFLDALEISNFHTTVDDFLDAIYAEIKAIDEDDPQAIQYLFESDLIASGTGFSVSKEFYETYASYQEAMKKRSSPTVKQKSNKGNRKFNRFALGMYVVILMLCPLFTFLTYRGYMREGISVFVLFFGLFNLGFYWFCISAIIGEIKAYNREKKVGEQ